MIDFKDCRFDGSKKCRLDDLPTSLNWDKALRPETEARMASTLAHISELQEKLYAESREGVVVILQAMDAAGKDSTIKHVMSGINPQGVNVTSFKAPSSTELAHDYLWRACAALPKRGMMGIFNRSYYEDVLVVRVREMQKGYAMPERCIGQDTRTFFDQRYRQIADFERYLYENGYRVVKVFLNVGLDEQKKRFLARLDEPAKNWKFSSSDLAERALWPEYMQAYEQCINGTATKESPWYVVPADQKWVARYLVAQAIEKVMEDCDPHFPEMPQSEREAMDACRAKLLSE